MLEELNLFLIKLYHKICLLNDNSYLQAIWLTFILYLVIKKIELPKRIKINITVSTRSGKLKRM
jgi:hypothetical protein